MKILRTKHRSLHLKHGIVLSAGVSALLFAAAVLDPSSQPLLTIGKYVLESADLEGNTDNFAYRPWYEHGAWTGDIIQYNISSSGARVTDAASLIGNFDASDLIAYDSSTKNWTARERYTKQVNSNSDYWKDTDDGGGRNIITANGANQIDFLWDNLSSTQKLALDPDSVADISLTGEYDSPILNFIRGNRSDEKSQVGGTLRTRYSLLGDITRSPIFIAAPREIFNLPNFRDFENDHDEDSERDGRVIAPSNNGMLVVFDHDNGKEAFSYIPSMVIPTLGKLTAVPYSHTHYLDSELTAVSAEISSTWKTVLTGGGGAGFKGLFALDMTEAAGTPGTTAGDDRIIFEVDTSQADVGYVHGRPQVGKVDAGNGWHVFSGNGYGSSGNTAKLLIVGLDGNSINAHSVVTISTNESGSLGLSSPVLIDADNDNRIEIVFAGDLAGDMWMFEINQSTLSSSTATKIFDGSIDQPITIKPTVAKYAAGYIVYFGTGSLLSIDDATNTDTQAFYAVYTGNSAPNRYPAVGTDSVAGSPNNGTDFVRQVLSSVEDATFGANTKTVRLITTSHAVDLLCSTPADCPFGWKIDLPGPHTPPATPLSSERLLGAPFLRAGRIQFVTTNPYGEATTNTDGDSWVMSLDFLSGHSNGENVYNLDGDGELAGDTGDQVSGESPVGISLGVGNISQPTFALLSQGLDKMFINGIILPALANQPLILNGHLDVETDSPSGGTTAPNLLTKHSEGYQTALDSVDPTIALNDGLGGEVDGHFHDYDTSNNVRWVDLFDLEPRRGLANATPKITGTTEPCAAGSVRVPADITETFEACLDAIEPELNRVTEVGIDATNDTFIIALANADLSPSAILQIGCRIWNAKEYQDMITTQLEAGIAPGSLVDTNPNPIQTHVGSTLLFTLDSILGDVTDTCPTDDNFGDSSATLRVSFNSRSILDGGVFGTRSQCVTGLHTPTDKVCYSDNAVLDNARNFVDAGPDDSFSFSSCNSFSDRPDGPPSDADYIRDPDQNLHITELLNAEGNGIRWRNGALTVQLLDANSFALQAPALLPIKKNKRFGGTYAAAVTVFGSGNSAVLVPVAGNSGLLHETTMYWHYSALAEELRRAEPSSLPCYGDSSYNSVVTQELTGLNLGDYNDLIDGLTEGLQAQLAAIFDALNTSDEDDFQQALLDLAQLIENNAALNAKGWTLEDYLRFRDYAPGNVPEQHLLDLDKGLDDPDSNSATDGTPGEVTEIDDLDLEAAGPNFGFGRRNWIDLRR